MHHSLSICRDVAEKLKDVEAVPTDSSFAEGWPGIACFYAMMDKVFPDEGWEKTTHQYLKLSIEDLEQKGGSDCSLFSGLAGLSFAAFLSSHQGSRYQRFIAQLDALFSEEMERNILPSAQQYLESGADLPPSLYNLTEGLSGIVAYLLLRRDNTRLQRLTRETVQTLTSLLTRKKEVEGHSVPAWHVSAALQLAEEEREKHPKGTFLLNMPFGIPGCLAALSLAATEGVFAENLTSTIAEITAWLSKWQQLSALGPFWTHTISFEEEVGEKTPSRELMRDTWWYGIPAIARSLYLAARAIKDSSLAAFAEKTYLSMLSKPEKEWNMMGPSFFCGRAGVLVTTLRMAQETQHPLLWKELSRQEQDIKRFYNPNAPFGFQIVDFTSGEDYRWADQPGLFNGAAGIALSLLLIHSREELLWDRAFLLR